MGSEDADIASIRGQSFNSIVANDHAVLERSWLFSSVMRGRDAAASDCSRGTCFIAIAEQAHAVFARACASHEVLVGIDCAAIA